MRRGWLCWRAPIAGLAMALATASIGTMPWLSGCQGDGAMGPSTSGEVGTARLQVGLSAAQISEGQTVRIQAVYSDPAGGSQIQRGVLQSPDGASQYGDFVSTGDGTWTLDLSWDALARAAPIWFETEQRRGLRAVLTTDAGASLNRDLTLRLYCSAAGASACDGRCLAIGAACDGANAGAVCLAGQCKPGCFIDGVYYAGQANNGTQSCQVCDPARSLTAWSSRADGIACGVSSTCQAGRCVSGSLKIPTGISDDFSATWGSGPGDLYATTASGLILRTTDGWATFKDITPAGYMGAFRGVAGTSAAAVVAIANFGVIYRTTDSGTTWTQPTSNTASTLYATWAGGGTVIAVGAAGAIVKSSDGGVTWTAPSSMTAEALHGVGGNGAGIVVAGGDNGVLLRSANSGSTWSATGGGGATTFFAVTATDASTFYAAGSNAVVLRSDDSGQTWKPTTALGVVGNARSLWGNATDGIYVGISNGTLWRSLDRGQTWSGVPTGGATNSWYGMWGTAGGAAYAVGAGGSVLRMQ